MLLTKINYFLGIYGGFARSCIAKTSEASTNIENEYTVTDEDGCATDKAIFGEWERNEDGSALRASFNAFKFPSSDNIKFQCNIRVCFGKCQPVRLLFIHIIWILTKCFRYKCIDFILY